MDETADAINEEAMRWVAVLDREGPDAGLEAELETWLAGDTRRQGAFLRAQAAWGALDRASLTSAVADDARPSRRGMLIGGGVLAASVVGAAGGALVWREMRGVRIETARGEIRRVPLQDGSLAVVNTSTDVKVDLRPDIRSARIAEGEAWFQVAENPDRPFVVSAGEVRVRAVGTAFSVRRMDSGALVQVTEGEVEAWCVTDPQRVVRLGPGGRAYVAPNAPPAVAGKIEADIDRSLAWRAGLIILNGDTLAEAAAEFNRYNDRQIRIANAELAGETYVGRFRTNEPEAFVKAVTLTLGARAATTPEGIVIYRE